MRSIDLEKLVDVLEERGRATRHVTAIAGAPGAGKSYIADQIAELLNARCQNSAAVFAMDGFHYDDGLLQSRGWQKQKGAPHTFDVAGFAAMLARLRRNDETEIAVPVFDRSIEIARNAARFIEKDVRHLIVEGNYLLLDQPPWNTLEFDTTVFLNVPMEEIERRLLKRWASLDDASLRTKMEENDLPNARLILERSKEAEFNLVNS
ncbi:MAG: hypothetical protein AAF718_01960 [Pseudomonadota bacterium]